MLNLIKYFISIIFLAGLFAFPVTLPAQENNLDDTKGNNTNRTVGSANATFSPNEAWNATVGYSNFSTYTKVKPQIYPYYVDNLDSLNFYQVTQTFNGTVSYSFGNKEKLMNTLMTTASYQTGSSKSGNVQGNYSNFLTMTCSFGEQWIPKNLSWSAFFSLNYADATDMQMLYWGPGVSLSKTFLKNALTSGFICNYNRSTMDGLVSSSLLNTSLTLQYNLQGLNKKFGRHGFSLNCGLTNYLGTETERTRRYEFLTTVTYSVKF